MSDQPMDLRPLFDGIFGKQRTVLYKRPNFERRNLDDMLKELAKIPLLQWDRYVFSREPLDGRISASQRQVYMQKAWDCGVEWADKSKIKYGNLSAEKLANALGMEVEYVSIGFLIFEMNDFRKNTRLLQEKQTDGTKKCRRSCCSLRTEGAYRRSA